MSPLYAFNELLARAGWEVQDFSEMLNAGINVDPEGVARHTATRVVLEAQLSLSSSELKLFILERATDKLIRFVLSVTQDNLSPILLYLIAEQEHIDTTTFPSFLHHARRLTDQIWFVDHEGRRFALEFDS